MNLYEELQKASSEEDVKDIYIKALGLKNYYKNIVDLQTKEIWFEAKEGYKKSTYEMFTQLAKYVYEARKKGEYTPPFLCVIDQRKAAIMKTENLLPIFDKAKIKWGKSASDVTPEALEVISAHIGTYIVSFNIKTHGDEFIETVKKAIKEGEIIRIQITPDNIKQVFDKWVDMVGRQIKDVKEEDYHLLFYADIMTDGNVATHDDLTADLIQINNTPAFLLRDKKYMLGNKEGYRRFWAIYDRPPKAEHRDYLLARRDELIPIDERSFKGAYFTPLKVVDKAYNYLTQTLGKNWQREYIVWDMCCGVGNLEIKHSYQRNVFMSTLDQEDIDIMRSNRTCVSATRFQYDYLNDDITDEGEINYSLTNKVPKELQQIIKNGKKKILVLINPPYAETSNATNVNSKEQGNKINIDRTKITTTKMLNCGRANRELFVQFLTRINKEIPNATIGIFSTLKYINAPGFSKFRDNWTAKYLDGFIIHSKSFEGLIGNFPIGFLIWDTKIKETISKVNVDVLDKSANPIGGKTLHNIHNKYLLNKWINRPRANNYEVIPLKNAISPYTGNIKSNKWADNAISYMYCGGNDVQHCSMQTVIFSSTYGNINGFYVTPENLWQAAIVFTVRRIIKPTWINDRDQFLQPTEPLTDEFKNDCLIWMLFNGSNLTASADGLEWNNKEWSIVNHFIPFTEDEVNAPDRFESDFMVRYLEDKKLSKEAKVVMDEGKKLWKEYFSYNDFTELQEKYKLNRTDVGWYQIRRTLKERQDYDMDYKISFDAFNEAYQKLTEKIRPQVYELGFLKL